MSFPELTPAGDLPPGVHRATLSEVRDRFGVANDVRLAIFERLDHIFKVATETRLVHRFFVFGSFITAKPHPNDIDVFIIMRDEFRYDSLDGITRLLFDHGTAETLFGASLFWIRRLAALEGEEATIEGWQTKRDGGIRGIVEIVEEP